MASSDGTETKLKTRTFTISQQPAGCYPLTVYVEPRKELVVVFPTVDLSNYRVLAIVIPCFLMQDSASSFRCDAFLDTPASMKKCDELNLYQYMLDACKRTDTSGNFRMIDGRPLLVHTHTLIETKDGEDGYHLLIAYIHPASEFNPLKELTKRVSMNLATQNKRNPTFAHLYQPSEAGGRGANVGGGAGGRGWDNTLLSNGVDGDGGGPSGDTNGPRAAGAKKQYAPDETRAQKNQYVPFHRRITTFREYADMARVKNRISYTDDFDQNSSYQSEHMHANMLHPYNVFSLAFALSTMEKANVKYRSVDEYMRIQVMGDQRKTEYIHPCPERSYWIDIHDIDVTKYFDYRIPNPRRDNIVNFTADMRMLCPETQTGNSSSVGQGPAGVGSGVEGLHRGGGGGGGEDGRGGQSDSERMMMHQDDDVAASINNIQSLRNTHKQTLLAEVYNRRAVPVWPKELESHKENIFKTHRLVSVKGTVIESLMTPHQERTPAGREVISSLMELGATLVDNSHLPPLTPVPVDPRPSVHRSTQNPQPGSDDRHDIPPESTQHDEFDQEAADAEAEMEMEMDQRHSRGSKPSNPSYANGDLHDEYNEPLPQTQEQLLPFEYPPGKKLQEEQEEADTDTADALFDEQGLSSTCTTRNLPKDSSEYSIRLCAAISFCESDDAFMRVIFPDLYSLHMPPEQRELYFHLRSSVGFGSYENTDEDDVDVATRINSEHKKRNDKEITEMVKSGQSEEAIRIRTLQLREEYEKAAINRFHMSLFSTNTTASPYWKANVKFLKKAGLTYGDRILKQFKFTKITTDCSILNDYSHRFLLGREMIDHDSTCHKLQLKGYVIALSANDPNRKARIHYIAFGQHASSKSYLLESIKKSCIPAVAEMHTMSTLRADTVPGNFDGAIRQQDEMNYAQSGAGGKNGRPERNEEERSFKLRLSMCIENVKDMYFDEFHNRKSRESFRKCLETHMMNTNAPKRSMTPEFLDRCHAMLFMDYDREGRNVPNLICAERNPELKRLQDNCYESKILIHSMIYTLDMMITVGIFDEVKCGFACKALPKILTRAAEIGMPKTGAPRPIQRMLTAVRTMTKLRAVLLRFFSSLSVVQDKPFSLHHFRELVGDMEDYDPSIFVEAFGLFQEYQDAVQDNVLRVIRDTILTEELVETTEKTYTHLRERLAEKLRDGGTGIAVDDVEPAKQAATQKASIHAYRKHANEVRGANQKEKEPNASGRAAKRARPSPAEVVEALVSNRSYTARPRNAAAMAAAAAFDLNDNENSGMFAVSEEDQEDHEEKNQMDQGDEKEEGVDMFVGGDAVSGEENQDTDEKEEDDAPLLSPSMSLQQRARQFKHRKTIDTHVPGTLAASTTSVNELMQKIQRFTVTESATVRPARFVEDRDDEEEQEEKEQHGHDEHEEKRGSMAHEDEMEEKHQELEPDDQGAHDSDLNDIEDDGADADPAFTALLRKLAPNKNKPNQLSDLMHEIPLIEKAMGRSSEKKNPSSSSSAAASESPVDASEMGFDGTKKKEKKDLTPWFYKNYTNGRSNPHYVFIPTPGVKDDDELNYKKRTYLTKLICQNVHGHIRLEDVTDILSNFERQRIPIPRRAGTTAPVSIEAFSYREGGVLLSTQLLNNCDDDTLLEIVADVLTGMKVMPSTFLFDVRMDAYSPYIFSQIKIMGGSIYCPNEIMPDNLEAAHRHVPHLFRKPATDVGSSININTNAFDPVLITQAMSAAAPEMHFRRELMFTNDATTEIDYPYELVVYLRHIKSLSLDSTLAMKKNILPEHMIRKRLVAHANQQYLLHSTQIAQNAQVADSFPATQPLANEPVARLPRATVDANEPTDQEDEMEPGFDESDLIAQAEQEQDDANMDTTESDQPGAPLMTENGEPIVVMENTNDPSEKIAIVFQKENPSLMAQMQLCIKPVLYETIVATVHQIELEFQRMADQQREDKKREEARHKEEMEQRRAGLVTKEKVVVPLTAKKGIKQLSAEADVLRKNLGFSMMETN